MAGKRLIILLDTSVLLAALHGNPTADALFSPEPEAIATYVTTPIVLQELLLVSETADNKARLGVLIDQLTVLHSTSDFSQEAIARIRQLRDSVVHTNDLLIVDAARDCDMFLTYDQELLSIGKASGINSHTPEEFLTDLGVES